MKNPYKSLPMLEDARNPLTDLKRLEAINDPLLSWFQINARTLPWRTKPTAYRVWISEIMLQQTRVEAVKPYFERFMNALPDIKALSTVEEDRLMKLWEGLGYYTRARNLKKAAIEVMERYQGKLPENFEELLTLPGIGNYTAGAISSIAFGLPVPAVDGNVLRVISRILAHRDDIMKQSVRRGMEALLSKTMPKEESGNYTQALMEVGAILCIPNGQPKCEECPLSSLCLAKKQNLISKIPVKTKKAPRRIEERTVFLIENKNSIAIQKRPDKGLLAGLYEFPNMEGHLSLDEAKLQMEKQGLSEMEIAPLQSAKHIFSHIEWRMVGYRVFADNLSLDEYIVVEKETLKTTYSIPSAFKVYFEAAIATR